MVAGSTNRALTKCDSRPQLRLWPSIVGMQDRICLRPDARAATDGRIEMCILLLIATRDRVPVSRGASVVARIRACELVVARVVKRLVQTNWLITASH